MKTKPIKHVLTCPAAFAIWLLISALGLPAFAQGTAFTYQGRLNNNGAPANGSYDLQFAIFDAATGGSQVGSALTTNAVAVSNGLFTVTLDSGADRWLFLSVKTNGAVSFTPLTPLQPITATPYAITAGNLNGALASASLSGTYASAVTLSNAANSFSGNGAGLTNLNADLLGGLGAANFWIVGGNASTGGASLGNGDNQPLNLISWNSRVLRLETRKVSLGLFDSWSAVNTLGGAPGNFISNGVLGGTIAGGGAETNHLFSSEPAPNTVLDNFGTVGGGLNNTAGYASADFEDARAATVAGGEGNTASNAWATVGGGQRNTSSGQRATVGGGFLNSAIGGAATVGGGQQNTSSGGGATVAGGMGNTASNNWATVGGGNGNASSGPRATVGGGDGNRSTSDTATVAGGRGNTSSGTTATVGGGNNNISSGEIATVGGGDHNIASGFYALVPGGFHNLAAGDYSFAAGQQAKANHEGSFVWADSENTDFSSTAINQFSIRAAGGVKLANNTSLFWGSGAKLWPDQGGVMELGDSLAGFAVPYIDFHYGVSSNQDFNVRLMNDANGQLTLSGSQQITGSLGFGNSVRQMLNLFGDFYGIGVQSFTMYFRTDGNNGGFSWFQGGVHNDAQNSAGGGTELMRLDSGGNLKTLTGTIASLSDRNAKTGFQPVDSQAVLARVAALPISTWRYKNAAATQRHLGPMAQDFYAAFEVGLDDKSICTVDEGGVALAAIQGLNQKLEEQRAENAELKQRLDALEKFIHHP
jgi:hypothetical protein